MAVVHLEPDDVPAFEAGRVLAALNDAPDAHWLATAIEFPNEPDIGIRLGQRLLDRRDELGGYTDLAQVAAVHLIGPERFTEIVVALSGRPALDYLEVAMGTTTRAIPTSARLGLRLLTNGPWLGQRTTIVASTTVDGRPRPGLEVVLAAGAGRLRAATGGRVVEGSTLTGVTAADGIVRATWTPPAVPPLTAAGAAALAGALDDLPSTGATPASLLAGVQGLVQAYRWEPNDLFRRAVDALTGDLAVDPDAVDLGADWPGFETAITAWVLTADGSDDGAADAVAVRPLVTRDWRPALVRVHHDVLAKEARLDSHLLTDQRESRDTADLVGRVQHRVGAFLEVQLGRLGTDVARTVAATSSRSFVVDNTTDLGLDAALEVAPVIAATAGSVASASPGVVRALATTRSTVLDGLDQRVASELPPIRTRLDDLTGTVLAKVDQDTLAAAVADKLERAELDEAVSGLVARDELEESLGGKLDRSELDGVLGQALEGVVRRDELEESLGGKLDRTELDELLSRVVDRDEFREVLSDLVGRGELEEVLERMVDREDLQDRLRSRVSLDEFRAFAGETDARLRRLGG